MWCLIIFVLFLLVFGVLPEIIPGTQYWESRRRYDYNEKFGQMGRWKRDDHARDHYTAMKRTEDPRWISKDPHLNIWYMFDESVEDRRELGEKYGP